MHKVKSTMVSIEKHSIRISIGVAVTVIIFLIIMSFNFATWKTQQEANCVELDARITHVGEKVVSMRADIVTIKEQANARDIQLAQINTKLANIESLLIEIKQDIRNQ